MKKRKAAGTKKTVPPAKPVTVSAIVRSVAAWLRRARLVFAHGTTDPVAEAAFIVGETIGLHPDDVESRATAPVTAVQQKKIARLVERRIRTRKPAAYLLKRIYMLGVPFDIDERAIVPRSFLGEIFTDETFAGEEFSLIPDEGSVRNVLDLCTGSGCLAILAAMRFPAAKVDAVELSKGAFELAKQNVARHRLAKRIRVLNGDLFVPVKGKRYDLIITNPPNINVDSANRADHALGPWSAYTTRFADTILDSGQRGYTVSNLVQVLQGRLLLMQGYRDLLEQAPQLMQSSGSPQT